MRCPQAVFAALMALGLMAGCTKSTPPGPAVATVTPQEAAAGAVNTFLEAVRVGDQKLTREMLTELARQKTEEHDLVVAPSQNPSASFSVGTVEIIENEVAHVASVWTDVGDDGQPASDEIIWVLRLEDAGWRIGGMVTMVFPDQPPLMLNFEDPEDMIRKQQLVEEEMIRRMRSSSAMQPAAGETSVQ